MPAVAGVNQRERILDASLRLMAEHGSAGVSMRQLARACDLQVAAIYHYFPSKDALLAAVIDERRYGARLAEVPHLDPAWAPERRMRAVVDAVWEGAMGEEDVWRLLLGEGLRGEPAALPVGRDLLAGFRVGLAAWLAEVVPELTKPGPAVELIIGQMFVGLVRVFFEPDASPADLGVAVSDTVVELLFPAAVPSETEAQSE